MWIIYLSAVAAFLLEGAIWLIGALKKQKLPSRNKWLAPIGQVEILNRANIIDFDSASLALLMRKLKAQGKDK
jgi:hypothetical protein